MDFAMRLHICFLRPRRSRHKLTDIIQDFKYFVIISFHDLCGLSASNVGSKNFLDFLEMYF